jgi:capsular polysaccharide biosynthesis protein/cellulose biosynthesis protein BcsQ
VNTQGPGTFRDYLRIARRQAWIIVAVTVLGVLGAAFFSARQDKLYEASATVLVSGFDPSQPPDMFLQTQADIATDSPELAERVRRALHLQNDPPISVAPRTNSALLTFSSTTSVPALSAKIATEYAEQFKKFQQRLAAADVKTAAAFLVRPAAPGTQVQPRTTRNLVLGFLFGLILGCGLAFLRDALDTRVRTTEEIAERLDLPLLARLPKPSAELRRADRLVTVSEPDGLAAEGFKIMRANVDFARMEADARTLLVTSAHEGDGKSTTIANLAVLLARAGQRVVLVDLDLRRPFIHQFFDLDGPGVAQVATGAATLEEALAPIPLVWPGANASWNGHESDGLQPSGGLLEVLPAGPMPSRLDDVLAKNILAGMLDGLRERADVVLIDSPPLLAGDAMATSAAVDAIVIVLNMDRLRRPVLRELRRVLDSIPTRKIGFVVAGADLGASYTENVINYRRPTRQPERVPSRPTQAK